MFTRVERRRKESLSYKFISLFLSITFTTSLVVPPPNHAQSLPNVALPAPGTMVSLSEAYVPAILKGVTVHPENPLLFDFIVDSGHSGLKGTALTAETTKMVKYFLASLAVPEKDLWVNLSPYEGNRIIPEKFGITDMGRDLLAQDYILKQITASLMYPEDEVGKKFWDKIYQRAYAKYGTTEIPVNTFNKVWIVPEKAVVYRNGNTAFVANSRLKVMLEEDFLALKNNFDNEERKTNELEQSDVKQVNNLSSEVVKEVVIPILEKEVNEGKNFASLRQIYRAHILASWYKKALKKSLLGQVYADSNKTAGIDIEDKEVKTKIYNQYLAAFKKGVYDFIKEDYDRNTQQMIPRKYFSGGMRLSWETPVEEIDRSMLVKLEGYEEAVQGEVGPVSSQAVQLKPVPYPFDESNAGETFVPVEDDLIRAAEKNRYDQLPDDVLAVAGRDISAQASGARTGETSKALLNEIGAGYVVIGDPKRGDGLSGENNEEIALKIDQALRRGRKEAAIKPIIQVGIDNQIWNQGRKQVQDYLEQQLSERLNGFRNYPQGLLESSIVPQILDEKGNLVLLSPEEVKALHEATQEALSNVLINLGLKLRLTLSEATNRVNILLGGKTPEVGNLRKYLELESVDGIFVDPEMIKDGVTQFVQILHLAHESSRRDGQRPLVMADLAGVPGEKAREAIAKIKGALHDSPELHDLQTVVVPMHLDLRRAGQVVMAESLYDVDDQLEPTNIHLALQDLEDTSEEYLQAVKEDGITYVLLGHSEVRRFQGKTDEDVNREALAVRRAGLRPIIAIGETDRISNDWAIGLYQQARTTLNGFSTGDLPFLTFAYEPRYFISAGISMSTEQIHEATEIIARAVRDHMRALGSEISDADDIPVGIMYGGSEKPSSAYGHSGGWEQNFVRRLREDGSEFITPPGRLRRIIGALIGTRSLIPGDPDRIGDRFSENALAKGKANRGISGGNWKMNVHTLKDAERRLIAFQKNIEKKRWKGEFFFPVPASMAGPLARKFRGKHVPLQIDPLDWTPRQRAINKIIDEFWTWWENDESQNSREESLVKALDQLHAMYLDSEELRQEGVSWYRVFQQAILSELFSKKKSIIPAAELLIKLRYSPLQEAVNQIEKEGVRIAIQDAVNDKQYFHDLNKDEINALFDALVKQFKVSDYERIILEAVIPKFERLRTEDINGIDRDEFSKYWKKLRENSNSILLNPHSSTKAVIAALWNIRDVILNHNPGNLDAFSQRQAEYTLNAVKESFADSRVVQRNISEIEAEIDARRPGQAEEGLIRTPTELREKVEAIAKAEKAWGGKLWKREEMIQFLTEVFDAKEALNAGPIFIPRAVVENEARFGASPILIELFRAIGVGNDIYVESGAGVNRDTNEGYFFDQQYEKAGATAVLSKEDFMLKAEELKDEPKVVVSIKEPKESEYPLLNNATLFTYLHLADFPELTRELVGRVKAAVAYETVSYQEDGINRTPILAPASDAAGWLSALRYALSLRSEYPEKGLDLLFQNHAREYPAIPHDLRNAPLSGKTVMVLAGGVAGEAAAFTSAQMGAQVYITEINDSRIQELNERISERGLTDKITILRRPDIETYEHLGELSDDHEISKALMEANSIIGTILIEGAKAPKEIRAELYVKLAKGGNLEFVADIAIDQGGNIEGSEKHKYEHGWVKDRDGIGQFTVTNMPSAIPKAVSLGLERAKLTYLLALLMGPTKAIQAFPELARGFNIYNGKIMHPNVAKANQDLEYVPVSDMFPAKEDTALQLLDRLRELVPTNELSQRMADLTRAYMTTFENLQPEATDDEIEYVINEIALNPQDEISLLDALRDQLALEIEPAHVVNANRKEQGQLLEEVNLARIWKGIRPYLVRNLKVERDRRRGEPSVEQRAKVAARHIQPAPEAEYYEVQVVDPTKVAVDVSGAFTARSPLMTRNTVDQLIRRALGAQRGLGFDPNIELTTVYGVDNAQEFQAFFEFLAANPYHGRSEFDFTIVQEYENGQAQIQVKDINGKPKIIQVKKQTFDQDQNPDAQDIIVVTNQDPDQWKQEKEASYVDSKYAVHVVNPDLDPRVRNGDNVQYHKTGLSEALSPLIQALYQKFGLEQFSLTATRPGEHHNLQLAHEEAARGLEWEGMPESLRISGRPQWETHTHEGAGSAQIYLSFPEDRQVDVEELSRFLKASSLMGWPIAFAKGWIPNTDSVQANNDPLIIDNNMSVLGAGGLITLNVWIPDWVQADHVLTTIVEEASRREQVNNFDSEEQHSKKLEEKSLKLSQQAVKDKAPSQVAEGEKKYFGIYGGDEVVAADLIIQAMEEKEEGVVLKSVYIEEATENPLEPSVYITAYLKQKMPDADIYIDPEGDGETIIIDDPYEPIAVHIGSKQVPNWKADGVETVIIAQNRAENNAETRKAHVGKGGAKRLIFANNPRAPIETVVSTVKGIFSNAGLNISGELIQNNTALHPYLDRAHDIVERGKRQPAQLANVVPQTTDDQLDVQSSIYYAHLTTMTLTLDREVDEKNIEQLFVRASTTGKALDGKLKVFDGQGTFRPSLFVGEKAIYFDPKSIRIMKSKDKTTVTFLLGYDFANVWASELLNAVKRDQDDPVPAVEKKTKTASRDKIPFQRDGKALDYIPAPPLPQKKEPNGAQTVVSRVGVELSELPYDRMQRRAMDYFFDSLMYNLMGDGRLSISLYGVKDILFLYQNIKKRFPKHADIRLEGFDERDFKRFEESLEERGYTYLYVQGAKIKVWRDSLLTLYKERSDIMKKESIDSMLIVTDKKDSTMEQEYKGMIDQHRMSGVEFVNPEADGLALAWGNLEEAIRQRGLTVRNHTVISTKPGRTSEHGIVYDKNGITIRTPTRLEGELHNLVLEFRDQQTKDDIRGIIDAMSNIVGKDRMEVIEDQVASLDIVNNTHEVVISPAGITGKGRLWSIPIWTGETGLARHAIERLVEIAGEGEITGKAKVGTAQAQHLVSSTIAPIAPSKAPPRLQGLAGKGKMVNIVIAAIGGRTGKTELLSTIGDSNVNVMGGTLRNPTEESVIEYVKGLNNDTVYKRPGIDWEYAGFDYEQGNFVIRAGSEELGWKYINIYDGTDPSNMPVKQWREQGLRVYYLYAVGSGYHRFKEKEWLEAGFEAIIYGNPGKGESIVLIPGSVDWDNPNLRELIRTGELFNCASCTTGALGPGVYALKDYVEFMSGMSQHELTHDQRLVHAKLHDALERLFEAGRTNVYSSSGAGNTLGKLIPEVNGRSTFIAKREGYGGASLANIMVKVKKEFRDQISVEMLKAILQEAAEDVSVKGVLFLHDEPYRLDSDEVKGMPYSSVIDLNSLRLEGDFLVWDAWYDNEFAFSRRMVELAGQIEVIRAEGEEVWPDAAMLAEIDGLLTQLRGILEIIPKEQQQGGRLGSLDGIQQTSKALALISRLENLKTSTDPAEQKQAVLVEIKKEVDSIQGVVGGIHLGAGEFLDVIDYDDTGLPVFDPTQFQNFQQDFRGLIPVPLFIPMPVNIPSLSGIPEEGLKDYKASQEEEKDTPTPLGYLDKKKVWGLVSSKQ